MVECERILSNLLEKTPETHRDYTELGKVVSKFKQVCVHVSVLRNCLVSCGVGEERVEESTLSLHPVLQMNLLAG